jgi:tetratricopeptide (TPR) repeat protein
MTVDQLLEQAYQASSLEKKLSLAERALKLDPNCVPALMMLSQASDDPDERIAYCERGLAAFRAKNGEDLFQTLQGEFGSTEETSEYLFVMQTLALELASEKRFEQAVKIGLEMLDLASDDELGMRWAVMEWLLLLDENITARELWNRYSEDFFVMWSFANLLLAYREQRPEAELLEILKRAHTENPITVEYLLGIHELPAEEPPSFTTGSREEAIFVAVYLLSACKTTPGFTGWLRAAASKLGIDFQPRQKRAKRSLQGIEKIERHENLTWYVESRKLGTKKDPAWGIFIFTHELVPVAEPLTFDNKPKSADYFESITTAMLKPFSGDPARPSQVAFSTKTTANALRKRLEKLEIESIVESNPQIQSLFEQAAPAFMINPGSTSAESLVDPTQLPLVQNRVWLASMSQLPTSVMEAGEFFNPYVLMVMDHASGLIVTTQITLEIPDATTWLNTLRQCMSGDRQPGRPAKILFRSADDLVSLQKSLADWEIETEIDPSAFTEFEQAEQGMYEHFSGEDSGGFPALSEIDGIETEQLATFYQAAADFYQKRPWQRTRGDNAFTLKSNALESPLYLMPMGQMGTLIGLAIYTDANQLRSILNGEDAPQNAMSIMFNEEHEVAYGDRNMIDESGWPIAAPEAFPTLVRIMNNKIGGLSSADVQLASICLAAFAAAKLPHTGTQALQLKLGSAQPIPAELSPMK